MKTSWGPIAAFDSFTFRAVAALVTWLMIFRRLVSFSLPAGGVPMLTATRTSAPFFRAVTTGKFSATPPSTRRRPSSSTGAKSPGKAMLARIASATFPFERTIPSPLATSVAVARKGMESLSKSSTSAAGSVRSRRMKFSCCPSTRPVGKAAFPSWMPMTSFVRNDDSSNFLRNGICLRGTASTNAASQSIVARASSISWGDIPVA